MEYVKLELYIYIVRFNNIAMRKPKSWKVAGAYRPVVVVEAVIEMHDNIMTTTICPFFVVLSLIIPNQTLRSFYFMLFCL